MGKIATREYPGYDTKLSDGEILVLKLCGITLYCHYSHVYSQLAMTVPVRVSIKGQIEQFNHSLYLKSFNSEQTNIVENNIELFILNSSTWMDLTGYKLKICNIMAEGFRSIYLAFGFSKAENLSAQCMGYLGANMSTGVHVSFRDVTIKIPDRRCDQGSEWRHAPEAWAEIWEKSVEIETWARPDEFVPYRRYTCWGWADGKVSVERWYLSLLMSKNLLTQR